MSNKQILQFGEKKYKNVNSTKKKANTGYLLGMHGSYFPTRWSKLRVAVDKVILIKRKVVSIRGSPFSDDVLLKL